jgi:hypothetical protein
MTFKMEFAADTYSVLTLLVENALGELASAPVG